MQDTVDRFSYNYKKHQIKKQKKHQFKILIIDPCDCI